MDTITSSALEEICCSGANGISILKLWPKLHNSVTCSGFDPSSTGVKQAIWSNLLNIHALQFKPTCSDSLNSIHLAEKLNLTIVADDHLRSCFFGVYDLEGITSPQLRTLELLAIARSNGITQHDLAKELGMKGNDIFNVVRKLECQGLIVRQSTLVRKKGISSTVTTNMLYLYRYARHLGSQQRLEITKEEGSLGSTSGDIPSVLVKDFLPGIKAICDKLEAAHGKVLLVSDIKQCLGYRNKSGHRAWRNICNRLKDAHVVEELKGKVNGKVVSCLRLLKKFSPTSFEGKTLGCGNDDVDPEQASNIGKRGHITDQVVELPIEHQIYDMIDAEGSKGMTIIEVSKRLGINNKKYYNRLISMFSRFGMRLRSEAHKRGTVYRVWASGKFNYDQSETLPSKSEDAKNRNVAIHTQPDDPAFHEDLILTVSDLCPLEFKGDVSSYGKQKSKEIEPEASNGYAGLGERNDMLICTTTSQNLVHDSSGTAPNATLDLVNPLSPLKPQLDTRYPRFAITEDTIQRERRILKKLQEEKFVIRADLQRWLESYEKDKGTTMASKTLIHSLNKLQQQEKCKCIKVSVPIMTNCGRIRTKEVVLHPSIEITPGLLSQIHDKLRSHEMERRGHGLSRLKNDLSVPVLNEVQISHHSVVSDAQSVKSEAMRTNGFVLAKMIRAKLLHSFLWNYLHSSPDWGDAFSFGKHGYDMNNPHSTCKLFALDIAIKAIPLELFLQVVGSTKKFDDLIEKCRSGLRLSDLPVQEYKSLMDTLATGRLSWIIDVLRRLKLIRLVSDGKSEDEQGKVLHATFKHAMELKPYIEEPRTIFSPSSGYSSQDLRPQIRHDFVLFKRETVDDYWRTLEYCYSNADAVAAYYAFPGSSVPEVFKTHSWASVRVMTAEQRSDLLKLVVKEDPNRKLSFRDCEKIAKDLNLTLQQVLRVYYDRRRQRLDRFSGASTVEGKRSQSLKRKKCSEGNSLNASPRMFCKRKLASLSETDNQFTEGQFRFMTVSEEHNIGSQAYLEPDHLEKNIEESVHSDDDENSSLVKKCSSSRIKHQKKFSWTEKADRQLVIQYVTHRVRLGANFHRTDWALLPDLPAPPVTCKRRMANLKRNIKFRNSIMKLCNMLGERYAKHLTKAENKDISDGAKHIQDFHYTERWDDFDDKIIKVALDDALRSKRISKFQSPGKDEYAAEILSDVNADAEHDPIESQLGVSSTICKEYQDRGERYHNVHGPRSSSHNLPQKFIKHLCEVKSICKPHESLAVSNAVELLKLVFLNTSTAAEVPNLLAETLRRYSEHDLFAAFSYLREKKVMIGGSSGNSFALSHLFLDSITSSPFPPNTGERVSEFAEWLHGTKAMLEEEEEGVNLTADLQCGDIFYLFTLVTIGEVSITPSLPDEGVGEAEDSRGVKRKADYVESCIEYDSKKLKSSFFPEGETISRREKGFPGLMISLSRGALAGNNLVDLIQDKQICKDTSSSNINEKHKNSPPNLMGKPNIAFNGPASEVVNDSLWEAMAGYAENLMLPVSDQDQLTHISPELFRTVWAAVQKAGDQGLSMEQVSKVADMKGQMLSKLIIEVLVAYGKALKVNAYDSVHVVNALYRSKYFLTSVAGSNKELIPAAMIKSQGINDHIMRACNSHVEISTEYDNVHRVTILNLSEEDSSRAKNKSEAKSELEGCPWDCVFLGLDHNSKPCEFSCGNTPSFKPILPWINGDGTINKDIYKGLVRRILGTVMQNPGILEVDIIRQVDVLNPQNCRKLLELMILDKHLIVRKMHQTTFSGAPAIMGSLLGRNFRAASSTFREHFFANPLSTSLL